MHTDLVGRLMDELRRNPAQFRDTDGYERLLDALRKGCAPDALKQALSEDSDFVGDLLWTVAELQTVDSFVHGARLHLSNSDKGTAAYALEIVLRGGRETSDLRAAFDALQGCDVAVCAHAARVLSSQGLDRLREVLESAGYPWSQALAAWLGGPVSQGEIEALVLDASRTHQVVGLALVTLLRDQHPGFEDFLVRSEHSWIREYGMWLASLPRREQRH